MPAKAEPLKGPPKYEDDIRVLVVTFSLLRPIETVD